MIPWLLVWLLQSEVLTVPAVQMLLLSGVTGYAINIAIFALIRVTSPLTNSISGTVKVTGGAVVIAAAATAAVVVVVYVRVGGPAHVRVCCCRHVYRRCWPLPSLRTQSRCWYALVSRFG